MGLKKNISCSGWYPENEGEDGVKNSKRGSMTRSVTPERTRKRFLVHSGRASLNVSTTRTMDLTGKGFINVLNEEVKKTPDPINYICQFKDVV